MDTAAVFFLKFFLLMYIPTPPGSVYATIQQSRKNLWTHELSSQKFLEFSGLFLTIIYAFLSCFPICRLKNKKIPKILPNLRQLRLVKQIEKVLYSLWILSVNLNHFQLSIIYLQNNHSFVFHDTYDFKDPTGKFSGFEKASFAESCRTDI